MPEVIVMVAAAAAIMITITLVSDTNPMAAIPFVATIGLITWIVVANVTRDEGPYKTYRIVTVGDDISNRKQIAVIDNGILDVTTQINKAIDETRCRLGVIKWHKFSAGILLMFAAERDYEIVCK